MKITGIVLCMLFAAGRLMAQDQTIQDLKKQADKTFDKPKEDTIPRTWRTGGLFNLTFGQTSLSNWAAGGDELTLNVNGLLSTYAYYKKDRHMWDNNLDLALGYVKTTSLGTRKSDDRIDLTSKYGYEVAKSWYAGLLFNFRSQFTEGFNYPANAPAEKISNFLAPAYALLSLGMNYKPNDNFSVFISPITARWVIVKDNDLSARGAYGVDTGKHVKVQVGAFLSAQFQKDILKNVNYKSKLDLFSNYLKNPQNINVYMTNLLSLKINNYLTSIFALDIIYDDNVRVFGPNKNAARTQMRESISIGFAYKFDNHTPGRKQ